MGDRKQKIVEKLEALNPEYGDNYVPLDTAADWIIKLQDALRVLYRGAPPSTLVAALLTDPDYGLKDS